MYLATSDPRLCAHPSTTDSYIALAFAGTADDLRFRAQTSPAGRTAARASSPAEEHKDAFDGRTADPRIPAHSLLAAKRHNAIATMPHDLPAGIHDASASIDTPDDPVLLCCICTQTVPAGTRCSCGGIYADKHDASDSLSTPDAPSLLCCICTHKGPAGPITSDLEIRGYMT